MLCAACFAHSLRDQFRENLNRYFLPTLGPLKNPGDNGVGNATLLANILLRSDWLALFHLISTFLYFL